MVFIAFFHLLKILIFLSHLAFFSTHIFFSSLSSPFNYFLTSQLSLIGRVCPLLLSHRSPSLFFLSYIPSLLSLICPFSLLSLICPLSLSLSPPCTVVFWWSFSVINLRDIIVSHFKPLNIVISLFLKYLSLYNMRFFSIKNKSNHPCGLDLGSPHIDSYTFKCSVLGLGLNGQLGWLLKHYKAKGSTLAKSSSLMEGKYFLANSWTIQAIKLERTLDIPYS